jgi:plastocyanin
VRRQTRDRLVLPVLLPIGLLVVIALVLYGFSRILLSLSHDAATATALAVAMSIMIGAAVVAGRTFVRASSLAGLVGAVAGVAMLAGGIALVSIGTEGEGGGGGEVTTVQLVAANLAFSPTSLTVPAGQPFDIELDNQDAGVQHNVQIFQAADFSGTPVFDGELVTGPAKVTYAVPALEAGTYAFRCVVHPTMTGTIEVVEGGGGEGGGGEGGATVTVTAQNISFDTDTIELPADTASTIAFVNKDAGVQHNISIYTDDTATESLFKGELVTGADQATYEVPPLPAGEYFFRCDVHPNMNGKVVVGGGGGAGSPAPSPTEAAVPSPTEAPADGGAAEVTTEVTAQGLAFDTAEIVLPAGKETSLHFVNDDAGVQHNIVIATDSSLSDQLFTGELITGVAETDYTIPPLDAGTYSFVCLVHPTMNGTVTVA